MQSCQQPLLSLAVLLAGVSSDSTAFAPSSIRSVQFVRIPAVPDVGFARQAQSRPLSMVIDPHVAIYHVNAAADGVNGDGVQHMETSFSSMMTAAADAAVIGKKYAWEFMGLHGERISPCGGSCPPGFGLLEGSEPRMDYFLPDDPSKAAEAVKMQQQATAAGQAMPQIGAIKDSLPGGKPEVLPFPAGDPDLLLSPIETDELEMMLRDADITSRLPMVAFAMVLIDFFFFNSGNDVYREDIIEDSPGRASEWMIAAGSRVAVGLVLALATIAFSNIFYHPL